MIHPTAIISSEARLAADLVVGPYVVIDGAVAAGPGTVIHAHARLLGPLTLGARNVIHSFAVLGDWPQDRKYKGEPSDVVIGDDNIFREGVTVHRGTGLNTRTVIGHRNYFMVGAHVGHNCTVGNDVTLVNGAALGGHTQVADRAIIGAYSAMHQFTRVGRLALLSNGTMTNVDVPPFFISMSINTVTQLNAVGLRRSGMSKSSIDALRRMFQAAFRENRGQPLPHALAGLPAELKAVPEVQEVIAFCNATKRGIARFVPWSRQKGVAEGGALIAE